MLLCLVFCVKSPVKSRQKVLEPVRMKIHGTKHTFVHISEKKSKVQQNKKMHFYKFLVII